MKNTYHAYMLRVWKMGDGEGAVWRASLEDPHSGAHRTFVSLELLMSFLQELDGMQGELVAIPSSHGALTATEKR